MKSLLELRKTLKTKKPNFIRQRPHKIKLKNKLKWRRAKGIHSKTRLQHKGNIKTPNIGYSSPKKVKGLNPSGLKEIIIKTIKDLNKIDPKTQIALLSKTLGNRKKIEIVKKTKELNLKIQNIKDIDQFIKKIEETKQKKKQEAEKKQKEREKSKKKKKEDIKTEEKTKQETKQEETKEAITKVEEKQIKKEAPKIKPQTKKAPVRNIPQAQK